MDLNQRKLSKAEWESVEIPVSTSEIEILKLITCGYHNVNIKINNISYRKVLNFIKIFIFLQ